MPGGLYYGDVQQRIVAATNKGLDECLIAGLVWPANECPTGLNISGWRGYLHCTADYHSKSKVAMLTWTWYIPSYAHLGDGHPINARNSEQQHDVAGDLGLVEVHQEVRQIVRVVVVAGGLLLHELH